MKKSIKLPLVMWGFLVGIAVIVAVCIASMEWLISVGLPEWFPLIFPFVVAAVAGTVQAYYEGKRLDEKESSNDRA